MAIQITDITGGPDYTSAHQLKAWQRASIEVALAGVSRAINGRALTRSNAGEIKTMIEFWQGQINIESGNDGVVLLETYELS